MLRNLNDKSCSTTRPNPDLEEETPHDCARKNKVKDLTIQWSLIRMIFRLL